MNTLLIRHVESGDPPKFQAICPQDARSTETVAIPSPVGFPVEGRPNNDLMSELRWYLEGFLDYPFPPETEHAERVRDALRRWGVEAFNNLFGDRRGGEIFNDATRAGYESLHLLISSDDPQVLGWPWEALRDPQAGQLAQTCQIERRLNTVRKPDKVGRRWPKNQVNFLLVTTRPYEGDVRYRSISRPLVELIDKQVLPAQVTVLRPPTFENLREHLRERPNHYHIVHFDGHGSYGQAHAPSGGPHMLQGPEGRLIFEDDQGKPDPITAEQLSVLLRQHHIPAIVLNACQSAMVDQGVKDPFASIAAALLKSGIRSVVAMAYSLYVSEAQEFLPAFYGDLFRTGDVARAARAGRQRMFQQKDRVCARGRYPLDDFEMHPALTGFLRATRPPGASGEPGDRWSRAFVDLMGGQLANGLAPRELHEQRGPFFLHGANFHVALGEAERLKMDFRSGALIQSLAAHAQNTRNFHEAAHLFERLATSRKNHEDAAGEAGAYHNLGMIAQEQRDFAGAEQWYRKALAIWVKYGDKHYEAITRSNLEILREAAGPGSIPELGETESPPPA